MSPFTISELPDGFRISTEKTYFSIAIITDLHLAERYVLKVSQLRRLRRILDRIQPDLIVNLGDFFCRRRIWTPKRTVQIFQALIGRHYPWTFVWGNHDLEAFTRPKWIGKFEPDPEKGFEEFEHFLQGTPNCLYKASTAYIDEWGHRMSEEEVEYELQTLLHPSPSPDRASAFDGFYGGNFRLRISPSYTGAKGWNLFILNSRQHYHIPFQALYWLEHAVASDPNVPALCFFHLPTQAFEELWQSGHARGVKGEEIGYVKEGGRIHPFLKRLAPVQACFAGHDHLNDFYGTLDHVTYLYARKTLRFGYGAVDSTQCSRRPTPSKPAVEWGVKRLTLPLDEPGKKQRPIEVTTEFEYYSADTVHIPVRVPALMGSP